MPRIESFIIDNNGFLQLINWPLLLKIQDLKNKGILTDILQDFIYSTVDSYVTDILGCYDSCLQNQPDAVKDVGDYIYQISALTAMHTVFPLFFEQYFCCRPFVFVFTDLHQSNNFLDEDWHIISLVDLEWACSWPIKIV